MNTKFDWRSLIVSIGIALGVGVLSSFLAPSISGQYSTLYKPALAPPGWLFPIVWTVLYILMGIAAYIIYESPAGEARNSALLYYGAQLVVNLIWPVIFFRCEAYVTAFFWLLLLWYLVFITFRKFTEISQLAGNLLIPYLVWLTFAGYLNLAIAIADITHKI